MLAARPEQSPEIIWRAFELNPAMPKEGMDRKAYLEMKFGTRERAKKIYDFIDQAGQKEKIPFRFDLIQRTPNTLLAHVFIKAAGKRRLAEKLMDRLFTAYFEEGEDIGQLEFLDKTARSIGLDDALLEGLTSFAPEVEEDLKIRDRIGGVPHFVFAGKYALAGAQEPEILLRLFDLADKEEPIFQSV